MGMVTEFAGNYVSEKIFVVDEKMSLLYASDLSKDKYADFDSVCKTVCPVNNSCEICFIQTAIEINKYDEMQFQSPEGVIQVKVWPVHLDIVNLKVGLIVWKNITSQEAMEAQVYHAQKLEAIGELAAGIAHEINNPIGFIYGNMKILKEYTDVIKQLAEIASEVGNNENCDIAQLRQRYQQLDEQENVDDVISDLKQLLEENIDGASRVSEIVSNLKSFARPDLKEKVQYNINDAMVTTLKIMNNELKYKCEVIEKYGLLPYIECFPGELNQVFMNIISNAAQSITSEGVIEITTSYDGKNVMVEIKDNGCGIPSENINHIFDPFFTTKPVGKGTGLGLSVSHGIIEKHGGEIEVSSKPGEGTTFKITLPVELCDSNDDECKTSSASVGL